MCPPYSYIPVYSPRFDALKMQSSMATVIQSIPTYYVITSSLLAYHSQMTSISRFSNHTTLQLCCQCEQMCQMTKANMKNQYITHV